MAKIRIWLKSKARRILIPLIERGDERWCPVCGKSLRRFFPSGNPPRADAKCFYCGSLERHRFIWWFFQEKTGLMNGERKHMLHFAPEPCFEPRLKELLGDSYLTADLFDPRAMISMDITDIQFADETFDVVYCSHVLEHVPDDRKAIREMVRVLKKDGWAIITVPVNAEQTFEDPTVVTPEERLRLYGQHDHVRRYGPDFSDRLSEAGFKVQVYSMHDFFDAAEIKRMGLSYATGEIFFCTK